MTATINVMGGELGDIFWDLAPWINYQPGYDLGCSIYVANPTDTEKEYALMARLSRSEAVLSEEGLQVKEGRINHYRDGVDGKGEIVVAGYKRAMFE